MPSAAYEQWRLAREGQVPLVTFVEFELDDQGTMVRLVRGRPTGEATISWLGETWNARNLEIDGIESNIEYETSEATVAIENVDGVAAGWVELNDLEGRPLTIYRVPLSLVSQNDVTDADRTESTIQEQGYERGAITLTIGQPHFVQNRAPYRRWERLRCQHAYPQRFRPGRFCGYPSNYFEADTEQDYLHGVSGTAEKQYKHGVFAINQDNANTLEAANGVLDIKVGGQFEWDGATRTGPFAYKKISGDFDVFTKVVTKLFNSNTNCGLLVQGDGAAEQDNWVTAAFETGDSIRMRYTVADVTLQESAITTAATVYVRIVRIGTSISVYYSEDENENWTLLATHTVDLGATARVGIFVSQASISPGQGATFEYLRFNSGGLSDCDYGYDSDNGCVAHDNTARFLAFRGIPKRA